MNPEIKSTTKLNPNISVAILATKKSNWKQWNFTPEEVVYLEKQIKADKKFIVINQFKRLVFVQLMEEYAHVESYRKIEGMRESGNKICVQINAHKYNAVQIVSEEPLKEEILALAEGCALSNYQFLKYKTAKKEGYTLEKVELLSNRITKSDLAHLNIVVDAVFKARDLVNEPQSYLNAVKFAEEIKGLGKKSGIKVDVLNKKQLESLKMGGILAVNKGSRVPPTFTLMEWKPKGHKNKKPLVLVGKGVVYDTGGLSLKPTPNSMDTMKCDMAGGALVALTLYAVAKANLPYHVVALIPATDNRPGGDAYTPGDVVTMFDKQTVEVLNTDAEGRMLLGDALAYAKKYKPELVLDFATLTGAAAAAIGPYGIVCMGTADEKVKSKLRISGFNTYERLVEFPFWDEYAKLIKSDIADMKNIGGPVGGAITAGKFLEKFTDYPWMHFDIAGPAFVSKDDSYRGKNGTGYGVRLMFDYIKNQCK
ncbi:MAG: leucyl aminopeptidase [Bacteroidia bacterium]|jgi:leucyl aminopeptidase